MISEKHFVFHHTPIDLPLIIFIISQFISMLFSINFLTSLLGYYGRFNGGFISLLCYTLLYWAFVSNLDRKHTQTIIWLSLLTALMVCCYGILQHFGLDAKMWVQDVQNRVFSTLGQPNWLAAFLVSLVFVPIYLFLSTSKSPWVHLIITSIFILTLVFTKSRSGIGAFLICLILFSLFSYMKLSAARSRIFIVGLLSGLFIFLIPNPISDYVFTELHLQSNSPVVKTSGPMLENGGTESTTIRRIVWKGAINIWKADAKNFLIGTGPETFAMSYYQFRPLEHNSTSEWELLYNKAHNEFLNYLATTGLFGLISYLILLFSIGWLFLRQLRLGQIGNLGFFVGWLSLSITNFWGFSVVINQVLLFILPGWAITSQLEPPKLSKTKSFLSPGQQIAITLALLPAIFVGFLIIQYWRADIAFAAAQKDRSRFSASNNPEYLLTAYQSISKAYDLNPLEPNIQSELGSLSAYMALITAESDKNSSDKFVDLALKASFISTNSNPYHPNLYLSQSRTLILLSALNPHYLSQADESLAKAQIIAPTNPRIPFNRYVIAKYEKDYLKAKEFLDQALKLKPDFADAEQAEKDIASFSGKIKP